MGKIRSKSNYVIHSRLPVSENKSSEAGTNLIENYRQKTDNSLKYQFVKRWSIALYHIVQRQTLRG